MQTVNNYIKNSSECRNMDFGIVRFQILNQVRNFGLENIIMIWIIQINVGLYTVKSTPTDNTYGPVADLIDDDVISLLVKYKS